MGLQHMRDQIQNCSHKPLKWDVSKLYTQGSRMQYHSQDKLR